MTDVLVTQARRRGPWRWRQRLEQSGHKPGKASLGPPETAKGNERTPPPEPQVGA